MSSRVELKTSAPATEARDRPLREKLVFFIASSWGVCAFFPIGVTYLHLVLLLLALAFSRDLNQRLRKLGQSAFVAPVVFMLSWTLLVTAVGDWYPDTSTRLFHTFRVALVLFLGLMLTPAEAREAFSGFLLGALLAALIVAVHHVAGLPDWMIWRSLLLSRNNFSSANMISMAIASGICFFLGIRVQTTSGDRWLSLAAALALGLTVALHAVSRNSQLLLAVLLLTSVICGFRSLRATLGGLALVLVLVGAMWQFSPTTQSLFARMVGNLQAAQVESNYTTSVGVRWRMYQEAIQGMTEHPVFGTGLGSWLPRWRLVAPGQDKSLPIGSPSEFSEINNPHNDFLLTGMETGVLGMLILIWLLGRFMFQGWKQCSTAGGTTVLLAVAIFVTALVNAPFRDAALGMTLLWLLGASVAGHKVGTDE